MKETEKNRAPSPATAPHPLIALPALAQVSADPGRIQARIDKLATFGGTPEEGTSRPGFSEADKPARE